MSMFEDIRFAYSLAMAKAAKELDTWRCPTCGSEAKWHGSIHIEWGSPECWPCHVGGQRVEMDLVKIQPIN